MPIQIETLVRYFAALGLEAQIPESEDPECGCQVGCDSYRRPDGGDQVLIVARPSPRGSHLVVAALDAYPLEGCRYRAALHLALLLVNRELRYARFELDEAHGQVHVLATVPLMESSLSQEQFACLVDDVHRALERYHPVLVEAMLRGRVDLALKWDEPEEPEPPVQPPTPEQVQALQGLIASLGGPERFEALLRHMAEQEAGR